MTEGFAEAELEVGQQSVLPDWIDYNGHMNVAYYVLAFDRGVDEFMYQMGITPEYLKTEKSSTFTLEMHINYLQELRLDDPIRLVPVPRLRLLFCPLAALHLSVLHFLHRVVSC